MGCWRRVVVLQLVLAAVLVDARQNPAWESMFEVPAGFVSYTHSSSHHRSHKDSVSLGFDGFLDEGMEWDARPATIVPPPTNHQPDQSQEHHSHHAGPHHHHHGHHSSSHGHRHAHHHHHHHDDGSSERDGDASAFLSFLEVDRQQEDAALREAEQDMNSVAKDAAAPTPDEQAQRQAQQAEATRQAQLQPSHASLDRAEDSIPGLAGSRSASPKDTRLADAAGAGAGESGFGTKHDNPNLFTLEMGDLNKLLDQEGPDPLEIKSLQDFRDRIQQLQTLITERPAGEESLTSMITKAAKSGEMAEMIPSVSLRNGLRPGTLPGLVDTATTASAMMPMLVPTTAGDNVKAVAELQRQPGSLLKLQAGLTTAMPDSPQLHPIQTAKQRQEQMKAPVYSVESSAGMTGMDVGNRPPPTSWLEVRGDGDEASHHHHHRHHHHAGAAEAPATQTALREDQAVDFQYVRSLGQGLETIATVFGGADPSLQRDALEVANLLKTIGPAAKAGAMVAADAPVAGGAPLSFLELAQEDDPTITSLRGVPRAHPSARSGLHGALPLAPYNDMPPSSLRLQGQLPLLSTSFGENDMHPSTYAANPSYPQSPVAPSHPEGELSWMLESDKSKGYGEEKADKLSLDRALQSIKGFIKKGAKMTEQNQAVDTSATVAETPNDGFGGWPQPFWWTRPPQWLDEIPGWMQRYELKKSTQQHKAAAFG